MSPSTAKVPEAFAFNNFFQTACISILFPESFEALAKRVLVKILVKKDVVRKVLVEKGTSREVPEQNRKLPEHFPELFWNFVKVA